MRLERMGLAALVIVAAIGACAAAPPPVAPRNGDEPLQRATPTPTAGELGALARLAMQTLSEHLSVPVKDVEVVTITPIEWRDSSMGCPKPDRGYMQVIMPGHVAVVAHGGRHYDVHMSGKAAFVCEPLKGRKGEPVGDIKPVLTLRTKEQLEQLAAEDLAARLGAPAEEIKVARSRQVEWPDTSLGCPQPNETPMRQRTKGYLFELTYRGRPYVYHADLRRVLPCPAISAD